MEVPVPLNFTFTTQRYVSYHILKLSHPHPLHSSCCYCYLLISRMSLFHCYYLRSKPNRIPFKLSLSNLTVQMQSMPFQRSSKIFLPRYTVFCIKIKKNRFSIEERHFSRHFFLVFLHFTTLPCYSPVSRILRVLFHVSCNAKDDWLLAVVLQRCF